MYMLLPAVTRTTDFIDNSRPCDHIRRLCETGHNTPKFVTYILNQAAIDNL